MKPYDKVAMMKEEERVRRTFKEISDLSEKFDFDVIAFFEIKPKGKYKKEFIEERMGNVMDSYKTALRAVVTFIPEEKISESDIVE